VPLFGHQELVSRIFQVTWSYGVKTLALAEADRATVEKTIDAFGRTTTIVQILIVLGMWCRLNKVSTFLKLFPTNGLQIHQCQPIDQPTAYKSVSNFSEDVNRFFSNVL